MRVYSENEVLRFCSENKIFLIVVRFCSESEIFLIENEVFLMTLVCHKFPTLSNFNLFYLSYLSSLYLSHSYPLLLKNSTLVSYLSFLNLCILLDLFYRNHYRS